MKNLFLSFLLCTICVKAQEAPPIDVVSGMSSNGESESVKMANEALKNNKPNSITENFERSIESADKLKSASFKEVLQNTPPLNPDKPIRSNNDIENSSAQNQNPNFKLDKSESWNQTIDLDEYYDRQADGSYIKKGLVQKKENHTILLYGIIFLLGAIVLFFLIKKNKKKL